MIYCIFHICIPPVLQGAQVGIICSLPCCVLTTITHFLPSEAYCQFLGVPVSTIEVENGFKTNLDEGDNLQQLIGG